MTSALPAPLCFDHLSLRDLPALELIEVAAALDCGAVSLFVMPLPLGPYRDLVNDAAARREVIAALRHHGLGVGVVEPFMVDATPDWDLMTRTAALAAELGGDVNALAFDSEPDRQRDQMIRLAEICRAEGAVLTIEAFSLSTAPRLSDALALAEAAGEDVRLTVDPLHVIRTGGTWADVAALPAERIRHVQLCDAPLAAPDDLGTEAISGRLPPGHGELGLRGFVQHIPAHARVAVEAPFVAPPGMTALERGRILVDAARALFSGV